MSCGSIVSYQHVCVWYRSRDSCSEVYLECQVRDENHSKATLLQRELQYEYYAALLAALAMPPGMSHFIKGKFLPWKPTPSSLWVQDMCHLWSCQHVGSSLEGGSLSPALLQIWWLSLGTLVTVSGNGK